MSLPALFARVLTLPRAVRHYRLLRKKKQLEQLAKSNLPANRTWKLCEMILLAINVEVLKRYTPSVGMAITTRSPYRSIEVYQQTLERIVYSLENEQKLQRGWSSFAIEVLSVNDFLCTQDGFYLNANHLILFLKKGRVLCELMAQMEQEEVGVNAHNAMVLIYFFTHFRNTLLDLYDLQFVL